MVICTLTIAGATRSDVGEAPPNDENPATRALAQAFKRASVKFGLGAYLYRLPCAWVEQDTQKKRFTDRALTQLQHRISNDHTAPHQPTIPSGEHAGKTLGWLMEHDHDYLTRIAEGANNKALKVAARALLDSAAQPSPADGPLPASNRERALLVPMGTAIEFTSHH